MAEGQRPPATKTELLERVRTGRAEWDDLIGRLDPASLTRPALPDGSSVKDLIAHITAYERRTAAQLGTYRTGRLPTNLEQYGVDEVPDGFDEMGLDDRNAALRGMYRDAPLDEVLAMAADAFAHLMREVDALSEVTLATIGAQDWTDDRTLLEVLPGQSYGHYEQHLGDLQGYVARIRAGASRSSASEHRGNRRSV